MTTNIATIIEIASRMGCTRAYTWGALSCDVQTLYGAGVSLRQISRDIYGGRIKHSVIQRILAGDEPTRPEIRDVLGLPVYKPAPACRECGNVHAITEACLDNKAVVVTVRVGEPPALKVKTVRPRSRARCTPWRLMFFWLLLRMKLEG